MCWKRSQVFFSRLFFSQSEVQHGCQSMQSQCQRAATLLCPPVFVISPTALIAVYVAIKISNHRMLIQINATVCNCLQPSSEEQSAKQASKSHSECGHRARLRAPTLPVRARLSCRYNESNWYDISLQVRRNLGAAVALSADMLLEPIDSRVEEKECLDKCSQVCIHWK